MILFGCSGQNQIPFDSFVKNIHSFLMFWVQIVYFSQFFNYNYFRMVYTNSILFELNQNQIIFLIRIKTVHRGARKCLGPGVWVPSKKLPLGVWGLRWGLESEVGSGV